MNLPAQLYSNRIAKANTGFLKTYKDVKPFKEETPVEEQIVAKKPNMMLKKQYTPNSMQGTFIKQVSPMIKDEEHLLEIREKFRHKTRKQLFSLREQNYSPEEVKNRLECLERRK